MSSIAAYTSRRAKAFQRILLFVGANETGGHAYLYRMLQKTTHPLFILYAIRRPTDGSVAFSCLQQSEEFQKLLKETESTMSMYLSPATWVDYTTGRDWVAAATQPILRASRVHGERPISYIFINGHENFGMQPDLEENKGARQLRLEKYWAPYAGALTTIARPDKENSFDHQMCYLTTKIYVAQMSAILGALLPLVRNDGKGVVVLKTPQDGDLRIVNSQQMRAGFIDPTPQFYELTVRKAREAADTLLKRKKIDKSPWPEKKNWLRLCDVFAKSAITMYRSFTPFENIAIRRCSHNYDDIDGPVSLLMDPDIPRPTSLFSEKDLAAASRLFPNDVEDMPLPDSIVRRTADPYIHLHNLSRGTRADWVTKDLVKKSVEGRLVRSTFPRLQSDQGTVYTRYTPFDQRTNPPIKNPPKGPKS
ncbi:hypothetical protein TWF718_007748 [Orbilia javanica]|uniref:Uncharacterized protein n=1 Tax=Orbilia javanica TaxID=47235 RepID=A0AAN8MNU0_9PEZI